MPGRTIGRGRRGDGALPRRLSRIPAALLAVAVLAGCGGETPEATGGAELRSGGPSLTRQPAEPGPVDSARVAEEVTEMLEASTRSWNAGDLDGFVDDYLDSPEMTYVGGSGVVRGRAALRERYRASYWAEGEERDSLRFEELEVRPLGERHALALGRYVLYRSPSDSTTATGRFTLVLRRQDDGTWTIVHDHSS